MLPQRTPARGPGIVLAALLLAVAASAAPTRLDVATVRDVELRDRLFQRGIPVSAESFSPDGYHLAHLHFIRGGWLKRKPRRCAFLLDLGTGESRSLKTPEGDASRIGGWDSTGRYLLIEATQAGLLSAFTGGWTTYHWVYDVVTSDFVSRRPFTGTRDGIRFRWKAKNVYHGAWDARDAKVWALYEGELAGHYGAREEELSREDERRRALAARLAVGTGSEPEKILADVLDPLDDHWTQRGQRDPVVSDLFGDRPTLFCRCGDEWEPVQAETEHVAVLDRGLALLTGHDGSQVVLNVDRAELLPLPPPPEGWSEILDRRWDRSGGFYDENDPLPRDLQYRRSWDGTQGTALYFHYVTPEGGRLLALYPFGAERRVLRIVDLPEGWRSGPAKRGAEESPPDRDAGTVSSAAGTAPRPSAD